MPESDVSAIAAAQRRTNARLITSALAILTAIAAPITLALGAPVVLSAFIAVVAGVMGVAYVFARRGWLGPAIALTYTCIFIEHVGSVALSKALGPVPYIAPIIILLTAATTRARGLWLGSLVCLLLLAVEAALSPWEPADQQAIATAALYTMIVFVVSLLYSRGVERAFAVAEKQDRARAEAAAAAVESERRYRLIAESADDLIALVDGAGVALYLSPSHERILGLPTASTIGRRLVEQLDFENADAAAEAFERALRVGEAHVEVRLRRPSGPSLILDAQMKRVEAEPSAAVAIISRDVTERRDLQSRLQASERLEALGRLAGSVAHDFNNLLTVITGSIELARAELGADHPVRQDLDAAIAATGTAAALAGQLLTFSRRQIVVRGRVDIAAVLRSEHDVLSRLVGDNIRIDYEFDEHLPFVSISQTHVEQLAMNLAANARDAMPAGGRIAIRVRARTLADREVGDLVAGPYVEIAVRDEGVGIPAEVLPRLFEPLFSTKGGRGTGLGLATCQTIAVMAGGSIEVESEIGEGATFRVLLPSADASPEPPAPLASSRDARRVLVVDDDASVREMTRRMLRADGHEVVAASTIAEARAIIDDASIPLDALLTDVVLGQERGTDLIAPFRRTRPDAQIVVTSGYAPEPSASEEVARQQAEFLAKPYGRDQLLRALRPRGV
jgi:PAS domain S-box-containing protein